MTNDNTYPGLLLNCVNLNYNLFILAMEHLPFILLQMSVADSGNGKALIEWVSNLVVEMTMMGLC